MSSSNSLSISITTWSSPHDVRFLKAKAASLTLWLSMVGRDGSTSHGHRCHIHSGVSLCNGSVNLSVVPSVWSQLLRDRSESGGPCKRDGAPASTAFLNLRSACLRRSTCRARHSAMDKLFLFRGSFSRRRSSQSLRTSLVVGSCCSKRVFPRFTAFHTMGDFAIAVVSVPRARMNWCEAEPFLGKSVGPVHLLRRASWHAVVSL